jgi:hypothetical protein
MEPLSVEIFYDDTNPLLRASFQINEMVRENIERQVEGWSDVQTQIYNQSIRSADGQVPTDQERF